MPTKVNGKDVKKKVEASKKQMRNLEKFKKSLIISEELLPSDEEILREIPNVDKYIP